MGKGKKGLEGYTLEQVREAIDRAKAYAASNKVPLTVERLAAELSLPVTALRRYLREDAALPPRGRAAVEALRDAAGQATASVIEYAMSRGTSPNMHMMYLKQYAGYGEEEMASGEPVIFEGERDV